MGLFQSFSTKHKLEQVQTELAELRRRWLQVEQEWDATQARVSKVLRRIARAEQAKDEAETTTIVEGDETLPLTTLATSGDRLARIKAQLAQRGRQ